MSIGRPGIRPLLLLSIFTLLANCISYEPAVLVPSLTLSAEDIELTNSISGDSPGGVDLGIDSSVNESDSLFNVEVLPGIRVRNVNSGGPAEQAGIQAGDVILSVNGTETNHPDALAAIASQINEETQLLIRLRRNTAVLQVDITVQPTANAGVTIEELFRSDPLATRAGYQTEVLSIAGQADITGAKVVEIQPGSPLPADGFAEGDIILAVDGQAVGSAQGLITRLLSDFELGDTVPMTVFSNNQVIQKRLTLWDPGRRISRISLMPLMRYESNLNPQQTSLSVLDLWIFAAYRYERFEGERRHRLFEIFGFSSNFGELTEETD